MSSRTTHTNHARRIRRGQHRSDQAHIIDIENLLGEHHATATVEEIRDVIERYNDAVGFQPGELRHIGVNPSDLAFRVREAVGSCSVRCLKGTNGGENAILKVLDARCLSRHDRVVIGSGDGAFTPLAGELRQAGVTVTVVACTGSLNSRLAATAQHVIFLN